MSYLRSKSRLPYLLLAYLMLVQSFLATPVYALTSGPAQPEYQQLQTVTADNLVDPFTGNFQYSIPLFEIGGYPMSLNYSSDHKMEEDASWVGFGWSLSPGAINRDVRGVPDDFDGDVITRTTSMADNVTTGIKPGGSVEIGGFFGLSAGLNFTFNNYRGFSFSRDLSPSLNIAALMDPYEGGNALILNRNRAFNFNISANINSRTGMQNIGYGYTLKTAGPTLRAGGNINLGGFAHTPVADVSLLTNAQTFRTKIGLEPAVFTAASVDLEGFRVVERTISTPIERPAYGYLYLEGSEGQPRAIQDYNSERGGLWNRRAPRLPIAYGTPDVFMVSGIGMSGQISIARNDIGVFRPPFVQNQSSSDMLGIEFSGAPFGAHPGFNISTSSTTNKVGVWANGRPPYTDLGFESGVGERETAFMRMDGEMNNQIGQNWFNEVGGVNPIGIGMSRDNSIISLDENPVAIVPNGQNVTLSADSWNSRNRRPRATQVSYLTNAEAQHAAIDKEIISYRPFRLGSSNDANPATLREGYRTTRTNDPDDLLDDHRADHHISQISLTNIEGQRFIYGLPAYNLSKREITFNISGEIQNPLQHDKDEQPEDGDRSWTYGLVPFTPGTDDTPDNSRGNDNYFDEVFTDAYPYAHLLTNILSSDYVDRTGDGPTQDDLGQYVKIGYSKGDAYGAGRGQGSVGWRVPVMLNHAAYNPGNLADPNDDKGTYTYGRKESWFVHHMESRTHRVVFFTSEREDLFSIGQNGRAESESLERAVHRQLNEIRVYSLSEIENKGQNAVPLKTIHFHYADADHSICPLVTTNTALRPKLTLASVSMNYYDNERGRENPYEFTYDLGGDPGDQLPYRSRMIDRWGNQRPKDPNYPGPQLFPYTLQDREKADRYHPIGNLIGIALPSGGTVEIEYEADDYAYVQDKRAGQMFHLRGFTHEPEVGVGNDLYRPPLLAGTVGRANLYLVAEVPFLPKTGNEIDLDAVKQLYFEDVDQIYYETIVHLTQFGTNPERVTGFLEFDIEDITAREVNGQNLIFIKVEGVNADGETRTTQKFHPISYAAIDKIRNEIPRLAYDISITNNDFEDFLYTMLSVLREAGQLFESFYARKTIDGFAQSIDTDHSFIRLAEPTYAKIGDGTRVRTIKLGDAWLDDILDGQSITYTQEYTYTTTDPQTGKVISSGVAASEPQIGREECLLTNRQESSEYVFFGTNRRFSMEGPIGEYFYPGAQVGYARVSMQQDIPDSYRHSLPGSSVYEFYTARDFPVITRYGTMSGERFDPGPDLLPFVSVANSAQGLSQGYAIEVNNMHGKPKRTSEFGHAGDLISESFYRYRENDTDEPSKRSLNNRADLSHRNGDIYEDNLGIDQHLWVEMRESSNLTAGGGLSGQVDYTPLFLILPSLYPNVNESRSKVQSVVFTKLTKRYGILEEIEVTNNGSRLSTQNLVWDALTGAVLRNSTENEFGQDVFSQSIPAYYMEEHYGMGPAYENEGVEFSRIDIENGLVTNSSHFINASCHGDELLIHRYPGFFPEYERGFVFKFQGQTYVVREDGSLLNDNDLEDSGRYDLKIIRSGHRNMLSATAAQTTSLSTSQNNIYWTDQAIENQILSSSAAVYSDKWGNQCREIEAEDVIPDPNAPDCSAIDDIFGFLPPCGFQPPNLPPEITLDPFKDDLIACGDCMELFDTLYERGWIRNNTDYGTCETTPSGTVYIITQEHLVNECDFIDAMKNPWLTGDEQVPPCGTHLCAPGDGPVNFAKPSPLLSKSGDIFDPCFPWSTTINNNPFITGRRGNWRLSETYVARQQARNYSQAGAPAPDLDAGENDYTQPLIYRDGTFDGYLPFWLKPDANSELGTRLNNGQSHLLTEHVEAYADQGQQLETSDALGIPAAAQYSYHHQLMVAAAQNARRTDIGVENFEDYTYELPGIEDGNRLPRHFYIKDRTENGSFYGYVVDHAAHTGRHALRLRSRPWYGSQREIIFSYATTDCEQEVDCNADNDCACINSFAPRHSDSPYYFSLWVAHERSLASGFNGGSPDYAISYENPNTTFHLQIQQMDENGQVVEPWTDFYPAGPTIEGWQKLEGEFLVHEQASTVNFRLRTPRVPSGISWFYADDFRIQPKESFMTTYVYDPFNLRLSAQLDENNYATFYEYDDEGRLIRLKRETDRGVMTVSEQHLNLNTTNPQGE